MRRRGRQKSLQQIYIVYEKKKTDLDGKEVDLRRKLTEVSMTHEHSLLASIEVGCADGSGILVIQYLWGRLFFSGVQHELRVDVLRRVW